VNGASGTITLNDASLGTSTSFRETNVLLGGTGALADLHGVLTSAGTVPAGGIPYGTYAGQIQSGAP
jgi:phosphoribosylcarboxyaminoimidazole (NCAIR) mutase